MADSIGFKWGTLKFWEIDDPETVALLRKWQRLGYSMSAAMHHDTPEQKEILCQIIDRIDGEIWNDWDGVVMTKDAAKKYVMEYGQRKPSPVQ